MNPIHRTLASACLAAATLCTAAAGAADAPKAEVPAQRTLTLATVQSTFEEDGGARLYVRLKLQALANAPFSIVTYRVPDRAMLAQLRAARRVEFAAARIGADNTVTELRVLAP